MRFMMMYKEDPKVVELFKGRKGEKHLAGAVIKGLVRFEINTRDVYGEASATESGYALCCEGSLWSYLYHVIVYDHCKRLTTVMTGWL